MWYLLPKTVYDKMEECLMREDAGDDPEDPQPHGLFYDPEACLVFQLEVRHKGGYNSYEESKFLLKQQSIGETSDDIQAIMDQRHDLWEKVPERNKGELDKLLEKLYSGKPSQPTRPPAEETAARAKDEDDDEEVLPASKKQKETKAESKESKPAVNLDDDIDDPELQNLVDELQSDA